MTNRRWGITIPWSDRPLREELPLYREAEDLGYTDLWTSEVDAADGFTPLAAAAAVTRRARLGTAIVSVYTRAPATLALQAASLAELAPGRVVLGLGTASLPIVQGWNGIPFTRPLQRTRDLFALLRPMLSGERVTADLPTVSVRGFRYARPIEGPIPLYLAALRPGMLRLAGEVADGVILNFLPARDVPRVVALVREAARAAGRDPEAIEVVCRVFVCPTTDREAGLQVARRFLAGYLTVPTYTAFQQWLGYGDRLKPLFDLWAAGDRRGALAAIPDEVVDDLVLVGTPDEVREKVLAYRENGVDLPVLRLFGTPAEPLESGQAFRALAPP
jgi:probable F420-dependent oxidoreductase